MQEISILIPLYNVEKYVEKCLLSVLNNTFINKAEVIIVNDCTPDKSAFIAKKILDSYPNVKSKIINHPVNRGLAATRQTALEAATGKYIVIIDSDDWIEPDYIEKLYLKAEETGADLVRCGYTEYKEKETIIKLPPEYAESRDYIKNMLIHNVSAYIWCFMIKRELFVKNNITWKKNIDIAEDYYISVPLYYYANKVALVPVSLYNYNCTILTSLSNKKNKNYSFWEKYRFTLHLSYVDYIKSTSSEFDNEFKFSDLYAKMNLIKTVEKYSQLKNLKITKDEYDFILDNFKISWKLKICLFASLHNNNVFVYIYIKVFQLKKNIFRK